MSIVKFRNRRNHPVFSSFFDDSFMRDLFESPVLHKAGTVPAVNIRETDNDYRIEVAAPGMKKEDFQVQLEEKTLSISATGSQEVNEEDKADGYVRREFSYTSFNREFFIPEMVRADKISARYEDGVLKVTIPKTEEAKEKPARVIKVA